MSDLTLHAPDIACDHCKATIEKNVAAVPGVARVEVQVDRKAVEVDFAGEPKTAEVLAAVEKSHRVESHVP
jgi:copper chaperone CopZ